MQSKAKTVNQYIESLNDERQLAISSIRKVILKNIPKGFSEVMGYGMVGYVVPHSIYPNGYHCDPKLPLPFFDIASQKNYISIYHLGLYNGKLLDWFTNQWKIKSNKKLNMGKCCIRFKKLEDIPLDLIGELVSKISVEDWIKTYEKEIKKVK